LESVDARPTPPIVFMAMTPKSLFCIRVANLV